MKKEKMKSRSSLLRRCLCFALSLLFLTVYFLPYAQAQGAQTAEKRIAITFDDGPHPRYTPQIVSILEEYGIKATFFVIGVNVERYPDTARALVRAGHEIGNHTYSHPHMNQLGERELISELTQTEAALCAIGAKMAHLFRPPEGIRSEHQVELISALGYRPIAWDIDTKDWAHAPAEVIVRRVLNEADDGKIILFHDYISGQNTTITALRQLIPQLQKNGYRFVTVSELYGEN